MKTEALHYLYRLGIIDLEIFKIKKDAKSFPAEIEQLQSGVKKIEDELETVNNTSKRIEDDEKLLAKNLKTYIAGLQKAEEKVTLITSNEQYEAVYTEINRFKTSIHSIESEIKKTSAEKEKGVISKGELEARLIAAKNEVEPRIKELEKSLSEVDKKVAKKNKEREAMLKEFREIDREASRVYSVSHEQKKSGIVVGFITETGLYCSNCFSILPTQMLYDLRKGKKITTCEGCGVLLVSERFREIGEKV